MDSWLACANFEQPALEWDRSRNRVLCAWVVNERRPTEEDFVNVAMYGLQRFNVVAYFLPDVFRFVVDQGVAWVVVNASVELRPNNMVVDVSAR